MQIPFPATPLTKSSHNQSTFIPQPQIKSVNAIVAFLESPAITRGRFVADCIFAAQHKHPKGVVWVKHPFGSVILWVNCTPGEGHKYSGNTLNCNAPWASANCLHSCMFIRICIGKQSVWRTFEILPYGVKSSAGKKKKMHARVSIGLVTAYLEVKDHRGRLFVVIA